MSNFWQTSDNEDATATGNSFESGGGNLDPIPDNTSCLAMLDEVKWAETNDNDKAEYISARWRVAKPEAYANRVIYHKLFVTDDKPGVKADKIDQTRDKAKRMLAAIDANAGGKLAKVQAKPTDVQLASALLGKAMTIKVMVYDMPDRNDDTKRITGNWVAAVSAKGPVAEVAKPVASTGTGNGGSYASRGRNVSDDLGDDVPFITMDGHF